MQSFLLHSWALGEMVSTKDFSYFLDIFREDLMKMKNEIYGYISFAYIYKIGYWQLELTIVERLYELYSMIQKVQGRIDIKEYLTQHKGQPLSVYHTNSG